ncbi:thiopurine S-methyltransferase [Roseovarius tibetensis]|uniref:thiopurine S-methyltransferase n=1 Tax=Roseovarius tibetensis TaxID=2685897 RepID=UPI003D7FB49D
MDAKFWHERWQDGRIGFHEGCVNRMLAAHIGALDLGAGARMFLPLCGKAFDIHWLVHEGYRVAGVELSEVAVQELFANLGATPEVTQAGPLKRYATSGLEIFVGDIFALTADTLGPVDAVYDRAALVALPAAMRSAYTRHVAQITGTAPQLVVTFQYDQTLMDGPPFSLTQDEVRDHYAAQYAITPLEQADVPGGLKGVCPATETALLLTPS